MEIMGDMETSTIRIIITTIGPRILCRLKDHATITIRTITGIIIRIIRGVPGAIQINNRIMGIDEVEEEEEEGT